MLDDAEIYYTKTIILKPDHHMSWYNMGYLHQDRGHWEKSIDCFERATRILPEDVDSQINLGMYCYTEIVFHRADILSRTTNDFRAH